MKGSHLTAVLFCFLYCACALMFSCSDKEDHKAVVFSVPEQWQALVSRFEEEAAAHGRNIDITNLIIRDDPAMDNAHCGACNSLSQDPAIQKIITINPNTICWFTEEGQEALIFHELGHCILARSHDDSTLPNGAPKSVMTQDDLGIYERCQYAIDNTGSCDLRFRRDYYLNELFDPSTPIPDWAE